MKIMLMKFWMILRQNFMLKKKPKMYQLTPGNREHNLLISEAKFSFYQIQMKN